MHQLLSKGFTVLALFAGLIGAPAGAAPATATANAVVSAADAKAIQRVIQAQLNAFAADDAKLAFSYATPSIRAQFGSAENFLLMVQRGYPMVYRPANVVFYKPTLVDRELVQAVQFSDLDGDEWVATYRMQRQRNKAWRINGCVVVPSAGRAA